LRGWAGTKGVPFFDRHRRLLALGLVSLLLHVAVLDAVSGWLERALHIGGAPRSILNVRLQPPPMPALPGARASAAVPAAALQADAAAPQHAPPLAAADRVRQAAGPPAGTAPDPLGGIDALAPPDEAPERMPKAYRVIPPPATEIAYDMSISAPDGSRAGAGSASLSWRIEQGRYALRLESRYGAGDARDHARLVDSAGELDDLGIAPLKVQEQRDGGDAILTRFDRAEGRIHYTRSPRTDAIVDGSQDQASMLMQLAGIGAARRMSEGDEIALYVSRAGGAGVLVFTVLGEETLAGPLGAVATWHLAQAGGAGAARIELWLAPAYHWMPVQIRSTGSDGVVATQLARRIAQPPP
jgi:hypothetical protein